MVSLNVFYFFPHPVILIPSVISIYLRKRKQEVVPPAYTNFSVSPDDFVTILVISQAVTPFLRTGNNLNSNIFTTGNFILCGTPEMGVGLGVFGLGLFFLIPFHFWSEVVLQKSMLSWPISLENFPELL